MLSRVKIHLFQLICRMDVAPLSKINWSKYMGLFLYSQFYSVSQYVSPYANTGPLQ